MKLGDMLRSLLKVNDITQRQMADDLHIGETTLNNYIRNIREPDFETLKLFADYFGVTTDYLLDFNSKVYMKSAREQEMLFAFNDMTDFQKDMILVQARAIAKSNKKNKL